MILVWLTSGINWQHFFSSFFYVVTLRHGCMHPCPREQVLLQNYKAQRHGVFFKDTLCIEDEKCSRHADMF